MRGLLLRLQKKRKVDPIVDHNQMEEKAYFSSYYLPISEKANIQTAIDTHGSVRLGKGDYSGVNVRLVSGKRLYGHPSLTVIGNVTIAAGSTGVHVEDLLFNGRDLVLEAGGVISGCTIKSIKSAVIKATNAMVQANTFINIQSTINFNCSASGYIRNNKVIKHQVHGSSNQLILKGNASTPSYGNVHVHTNLLTPAGDTTDIDNFESLSFIGFDSEAWNFSGTGTKPMLYVRNSGDVKITDFGGGNGYSTVKTSAFDIDANNLFFLNKYIQSEGESPNSVAGAKTNVMLFEGEHDPYVRGAGTVTGTDLKAHYNAGGNYNEVIYNGTVQNSAISSPAQLAAALRGTQRTPWARPVWEELPNITGSSWAADRAGKTDSASYIQGLIDANGFAELPAGIFYIGSTLTLPADGEHGIVGAGSGKTAIVGLTDDFPLITLSESATGDNDFVLAHLTLQGGSKGLYAPDEMDLIAFVNIKYVIFRNQNYGIHLYWIFGLDNCFFDNISFLDCNIGFFQDPRPDYVIEDAGYIDKVVFYQGQYKNCQQAFSMKATRANNLNAWINCRFESNSNAIVLSGNNFPIAVNCDFVNNTGAYTIEGELSFYNCNFSGNTPSKGTLMAKAAYIEGCNFQDNVNMFPNETHYYARYIIINSTIRGNVTKSYGVNQAVYSNSILQSNSSLSKLLVRVKDNTALTLIDETPDPYPQLLVTQ